MNIAIKKKWQCLQLEPLHAMAIVNSETSYYYSFDKLPSDGEYLICTGGLIRRDVAKLQPIKSALCVVTLKLQTKSMSPWHEYKIESVKEIIPTDAGVHFNSTQFKPLFEEELTIKLWDGTIDDWLDMVFARDGRHPQSITYQPFPERLRRAINDSK